MSALALDAPGDEFDEGTMSHVGRRYDTFLGDKPLRVVVVGQEAASSRVTLDARHKQVHDVTDFSTAITRMENTRPAIHTCGARPRHSELSSGSASVPTTTMSSWSR
jgi:hypothetical protein